MERKTPKVALYDRGKLVMGLVVFGGSTLLSLLAIGAQARYHYRYAGAEQVRATVVKAEYSDTMQEKPNMIVLALADGREVTDDPDLSGGPARLEAGAVRTVLIDPHRPSMVAFPAQVDWSSVLFPSVLFTVIGVGGTVGMLLYRAFWGHGPVEVSTRARRER